jgi:hypothetical protein
MIKVLIKDPSTMTLEKFIKLFDKEGCIVLLEGKRKVLKSDEKRLVEIGRLLAASTKHCVFRSGNAGGADAFFKEGVMSVDPKRFQAIVPFDDHMKSVKEELGLYERISLDDINLAREPQILYESKRNKQQKGLVESYEKGVDPKNSVKGAYIVRDTVKVIGAPSQGISPAHFGIFYDDLRDPKSGGTGHTMVVCDNQMVPYVNQKVWGEWI